MLFSETTQSSQTVYEGRIVRVHVDAVTLSDGRGATREVVEHPGGVCIAALEPDGSTYVVEQYRYPMEETLLELPAGKLEYGEDPDVAAARELREETGLRAQNIRRVGVLYPSPGYCSEKLYLYIATGLAQGAQQLDDGELLACRRMPLAHLLQKVFDNTIRDAKTAALLLMADHYIRTEEETL